MCKFWISLLLVYVTRILISSSVSLLSDNYSWHRWISAKTRASTTTSCKIWLASFKTAAHSLICTWTRQKSRLVVWNWFLNLWDQVWRYGRSPPKNVDFNLNKMTRRLSLNFSNRIFHWHGSELLKTNAVLNSNKTCSLSLTWILL